MNALETHVLRLIGESTSSPDVFTDDATGMAQIRASLNDAIQELCMVAGAYKRPYFLACLEGKQFYRLEPRGDYICYVAGVFDRARNKRLEQTDLHALARVDPYFLQWSGPPDKYFMVGRNIIGIYFKPSAEGTILELDCVLVPGSYTDDKEPVKLRDAFQRAAVYRAVGEFYASRGDHARALEHEEKYLEMAGLLSLFPRQADMRWRYGGEVQGQEKVKGTG